ncbi:MAG TPA: DUF5916 domain-containing protein, partial [Thermoanaerobaculia bacterium]|nr:DUF5916 domain-containing protein [Thermoanaerobaculia bacterium]
PFSQLRFPEKPVHTWGVNITRRTVRKNEWVRIVNVRKGETGFVSRFADLVGLEGIRRERPLELVPYAVARTDLRTGFDTTNPFLESADYRGDAGLDLKYGLTSNLTVTATVNPDFGQVEVDPAVVNLSQFETFYPEKRPFFTEGVNIFRFGSTPARSHFNFVYPPQMFYSRRIGRAPQGGVNADYFTAPTETTILGAAKLTGKIGRGWSIGILDALTANERARFVDGTLSGRQQVEPMTNYLVGRATKEYGEGSRIGVMATSVTRSLEDELSHLRSRSYGFGIDGYSHFYKRDWIIEWTAAGSRVEGSPEAIALTQRSAARYYQRPDADHIEYDPTRTSLDGWGGRAMVSKQTGLWRPNVQVQAYSPGYEVNDVGFMLRTDMVSAHALVQYVNDKPAGRHRSKNAWFGTWGNYNHDGETFDRGYFLDTNFELQNYWRYWGSLFLSPSNLDDRHTRGGPLAIRPRSFSTNVGFESDNRKPISFSVNFSADGQPGRSHGRSGSVLVHYRPAPNLSFTVGPYFSSSFEFAQFLTSFPDAGATATYGSRYLFAELDQRIFELSTRADWTVNPRLSFQLYLQPFIAAGDYHDVKQLERARTADYAPFTGPAPEPDFNFRSVRGSAVMRWEFRPGSALYVVWNENRAEVDRVGDFRLSRDLRAIPSAPSHDVILVKLSYWLPL